MKITKKIEFTAQEALTLNGILIENSMKMVELLNGQKNEDDFNKALQIMQSSVAAQQIFFKECFNQSFEFDEPIYLFYRTLVESCIESINGYRDSLRESGDLNSSIYQEEIDKLKGILKKIPEKSLIFV
jgi:hypothetical protein